MVLDVLALCEQATLDADGRLSLHRIVSTFTGQAGIAPPFDIGVRLRYQPHEAGRHTFRFIFLDADGGKVGEPLAGERTASRLTGDRLGILSFVIHVTGMPLARPGVYACHFELDGEELSSLPFVALNRV